MPFLLKRSPVTARLGLKHRVGLLDTGHQAEERASPGHLHVASKWEPGAAGLPRPAGEEPVRGPRGAGWQHRLCLLGASGASTFPTNCSTEHSRWPGSRPAPSAWHKRPGASLQGCTGRNPGDGPKGLRPAGGTSQASAFPTPVPPVHRPGVAREWGHPAQRAPAWPCWERKEVSGFLSDTARSH